MRIAIALIIIIFIVLSCSSYSTKLIEYSHNGITNYTWCDEIFSNNNDVFMVKEYVKKTITNKIVDYRILSVVEYKEKVSNKYLTEE